MSEIDPLKLENQNRDNEQLSERESEMIDIIAFAQVVAENMQDSEMNAGEVLLGMMLMMGSSAEMNPLMNMQLATSYAVNAMSTAIEHDEIFKSRLVEARKEYMQGRSVSVEDDEIKSTGSVFVENDNEAKKVIDISTRERVVDSVRNAVKEGRFKEVIALIAKNPKDFSDELVVDLVRQINAAGGFKNVDNLVLFFGANSISEHAKALVLHDVLRGYSSESFPRFPQALQDMINNVQGITEDKEVDKTSLAA